MRMYDYKLKDLQLHKEKLSEFSETYYLSAVYHYEDNAGFYEVTIPRIVLPICKPSIKQNMYYYDTMPECHIDIGLGDLRMVPDKEGNCYYQKLIREKVHDMTLEEIEKKLGYKVRVVSEKVEK